MENIRYNTLENIKASGSKNGTVKATEEKKKISEIFAKGVFSLSAMKEYIAEVSGIDINLITNIDVKSSFSFIEVKTEAAEIITGTFKNARYNNRNVRIESRGSAGGGEGRSRERNAYGGGNRGGSYGEKRSYGGDRGGRGGYGEKRSYGGDRDRNRSYGGDRNERSDRGSDRGERRERSSDSGKSFGERKQFSDRPERSFTKNSSESSTGERKSNFSREKRPRKKS